MDDDGRGAADSARVKRFAWLTECLENESRRDVGIGRLYVATLILVALAAIWSVAGRFH
jgi:hypothetical protein